MKERGGREEERAWVSRKQMKPYEFKSWCEFASRCLALSLSLSALKHLKFFGIYKP